MKKKTPRSTFHRVMPEAGGNVNIIIGVVNEVKAPEKKGFVLHQVHEPSPKKIEE